MIITIAGVAGSGKSTIAKTLAKQLNLKHHSIGDLMREIAKERGVSLLELSKMAETDDTIDRDLDNKQIALKNEDNFIIDGRLTAHFIPNANIKVFLDCNDEIRAKRILDDKRDDEQNESFDETVKKIKEREESERKRYKQYYDVDYQDKKLYDIVIDTSNLRPEQVIERIINVIEHPEELQPN